MKIDHISVSRMGCHQECPLKYRYRYHEGLEPDEVKPWFRLGTLVHAAAENYVRAQDESRWDAIADLVRQSLAQGAWPKSYADRLPKILRNLRAAIHEVGLTPMGLIEHPFRVDLDAPLEYLAVGFIDRAVIRDGSALVIDYKTTKWRSEFRDTPETVQDNLQLRVYAGIIHDEFAVPLDRIECRLVYVDGPRHVNVSAVYTPGQVAEAREALLDGYRTIEAADPDAVVATPGGHCFLCDYRPICSEAFRHAG